MTKTVLSEDLIPALDKIMPVLHALSAVQQQQVIEMMIVNHLHWYSHLRREQRIVMEGVCKHVWQLIDQMNGNKQ